MLNIECVRFEPNLSKQLGFFNGKQTERKFLRKYFKGCFAQQGNKCVSWYPDSAYVIVCFTLKPADVFVTKRNTCIRYKIETLYV